MKKKFKSNEKKVEKKKNTLNSSHSVQTTTACASVQASI